MSSLGANRYGKAEVRVMKVTRTSEPHQVRDLTVTVFLEGDFAAAYERGENAGLLATDTMRNMVYVAAREDPLEHLESFAGRMVERFLGSSPLVSDAEVTVVEHPWIAIRSRPDAFQRGHGGRRVAVAMGDASGIHLDGGIEDLLLLRTAGSGWAGFQRDRYTTLPDTDDRLLATVLDTRWRYEPRDGIDYTAVWIGVRDAALEAFADHYSPSVQFTLKHIGEAVLAARPELARIHLSLPNRHHLLFDLERFGLENDNQVFQPTTEPSGVIEGTVERSGPGG